MPDEHLLLATTCRVNEMLTEDGISADQAVFERPRRDITHVSPDALSDIRFTRKIPASDVSLSAARIRAQPGMKKWPGTRSAV